MLICMYYDDSAYIIKDPSIHATVIHTLNTDKPERHAAFIGTYFKQVFVAHHLLQLQMGQCSRVRFPVKHCVGVYATCLHVLK